MTSCPDRIDWIGTGKTFDCASPRKNNVPRPDADPSQASRTGAVILVLPSITVLALSKVP